MKKIVVIFCFCTLILCGGCAGNMDLKDSFSEITRDYYIGSSTDGKMKCSVSVGEREQPYAVDGKHCQAVDFSLIVLKFDFYVQDQQILLEFLEGEKVEEVLLEFNPINGTYMADMGFAISAGGDYLIKCLGYSAKLIKESENFKVNYAQAIELSVDELGKRLNLYYNGKSFAGECYLKVISNPNETFDNLYWLFSVVGQNGAGNNVLIDVYSGKIMLAN